MTDPDRFEAEARRLTKGLLASGEREPLRRSMANFRTNTSRPWIRHPAVEFLVSGLLAAIVVVGIIALPRQPNQTSGPAGPTQAPAPTGTVKPTPTAQDVHSTITTPPPLALFMAASAPSGSIVLSASTYAGQVAGTLVVPVSDNGYDTAPDGSKVLDGTQIIDDRGQVLATISGNFPQLPIWADDSAHVCGAEYSRPSSTQATARITEFDMSGRARTVAILGPIAAGGSAWQVLACSPSADRVVVAQESGTATSVLTIQLSSGHVIVQHSISDPSWGLPVASHDGRLVAVNEASGVSLRNATTWQRLAQVVRWGSQGGSPLIGAALTFSWDGSRIIIDGGGASGGFHDEWMVDWATNRDVVTNSGPNASVTGIADAVPLMFGAAFFLPPGDVASAAMAAHLVTTSGKLQPLG
jgi:hypothetical protein